MSKRNEYNLYWGDMHTQFKPQWCHGDWDEFLEQSFQDAQEYLDFYPIVYYPAEYYNTKEGLHVESIGWRDSINPNGKRSTPSSRSTTSPASSSRSPVTNGPATEPDGATTTSSTSTTISRSISP